MQRVRARACVRLPTMKIRTRSSYRVHSRRCKCQLHVEKRARGESTNLDVDRNTDDPAGTFNAFENDPGGVRGRRGLRGRREGGYKGLESRLVDESDKKFIRRSVGAAPPRRWRHEQRKRKRDEERSWDTSRGGLRWRRVVG